jgi:hypothetical protein
MAFALFPAECASTLSNARWYVRLTFEPSFEMLFLLSRKEVQRDLVLSKNQISAIKQLRIAQTRSNYRTSHSQSLTNQFLNDSLQVEREQRVESGVTQQHKELKDRIENILSENQWNRLNQLVVQLEGPTIIFRQQRITDALGIAPEQMRGVQDLHQRYREFISSALYRYMGLQMNPQSRDISEADLKRELECLSYVIERAMREECRLSR